MCRVQLALKCHLLSQAKVKAEGKKLRDDKEKVMEVLFGLFEKHQYYNIKDLVKETRQPVTYLKVGRSFSSLFTYVAFCLPLNSFYRRS